MSDNASKILDMLAAGTINADQAESLMKAASKTSVATTTRPTSKSRSNDAATKVAPATQDDANDAFKQVMALKPPYGTGMKLARYAAKLVHTGSSVDDAVSAATKLISVIADEDEPVEALSIVFAEMKAKEAAKATK